MLVAVDDSAPAAAALRWAEGFVDHHPEGPGACRAAVLTAWSPPAFDLPAVVDDKTVTDRADAVLDEAMAVLTDRDRFERVIVRGQAARAVLDEAARRDASLIVVGSRGRSAIAQVLLGSVSRSVAARADCPVVVVPASAEPPTAEAGPVVVGYDDSPGSRAAVRWALDNTTGDVLVVSAWVLPSSAIYDPALIDVDGFHRTVEQTLETGLKEICDGEVDRRLTPLVQRDDPRLAILDEDLDPSLIVLGARGHSGLSGVLLGSTVTYVAAHSTVPVVIVPPPAEPAEGERSAR